MNADAFRHFYEYHFNENRTIWNKYIMSLTDEQFVQPVAYSHESVRDQVVHIMSVDGAWFSDLRGVEFTGHLNPEDFNDRAVIRAHWDTVEQNMRDYLANLQDDMLSQNPFPAGEDENLLLWQVLLHVANHGTDHRAQLLRYLNDLGIKTTSQDYIFFVYDNP